jgi:anthranilate synthase/aminodeoxychorismate synthase-like glutamine amidotransferase
MLGVCLGHQVIAAALGATVSRSMEPVHGRDSLVFHGGDGIFAGLPSPLRCGRYHSLIVDEKLLPDDLQVLARTAERTVMAIAHRTLPVVGLQFHPESILTECGYDLLAAFLRQAGLSPAQTPLFGDERREAIRGATALPSTPVTF